MKPAVQKSLDRRLARIEGQVRGLRRMIEEGDYCIDILTQLSAVRSALDQFGAELATSHVESCILGKSAKQTHEHCESMSQEDLLDELKNTLSRLMK
ncbi:metal-sensitive transcriptional regulator [Kamptonema cortianum]|nr:metal-sensitive transcriptional regulator [Geitlerinema splendidum]MDK3158599.1 metal-sensitive transcriptional regulator [Kamptonema cortianum]